MLERCVDLEEEIVVPSPSPVKPQDPNALGAVNPWLPSVQALDEDDDLEEDWEDEEDWDEEDDEDEWDEDEDDDDWEWDDDDDELSGGTRRRWH